MILNYDKKDGYYSFGKMLAPQSLEVSDNSREILTNLQKSMEGGASIDFSGFADGLNDADESLIAFLKDTEYSEKTLENYQTYLNQSAKGTSKFALTMKSIGSGLKNLAGNLLSFGVNAAAMMAISLIIKGISTAIDESTLSLEEADEATKNMMDSYDSAKNKAKTNAKAISELKDEYASLAKGVNLSNNDNLSLSTDSYERYLELTNEIADMYPELVKGYDAQGNAILNLQGNIENLTKATDDAQRAAYALAFNGNDDIENSGFAAVAKSYKADTTDTGKWYDNFWKKLGHKIVSEQQVGIDISYEDAIKELEQFKNATYDELWRDRNNTNTYVTDLLGIDDDFALNEATEEQIDEYKKKADLVINEYNKVMRDAADNVRKSAEGYLKGVEDAGGNLRSGYDKLNEVQQNFISTFVTNMSQETIDELMDKDDPEIAMTTYIDNLVSSVQASNGQIELAYKGLTDTLSSPKGITSDSIESIKKYIAELSNLTGETQENLKNMFGVSDYIDTDKKFQDSLRKYTGAKSQLEKLGLSTEKFDNTQKEAWLTAINGCNNAKDAVIAYTQAIYGISGATKDSVYSIRDVIAETDSAFARVQTVSDESFEDYGDTYDTMYEQFKTAKESAKAGDVGTELFKSIAAMASPSGATDYANWQENVGKIDRYFTENTSKGMLNFLNDMKAKDLAEYDKATQSWTLHIEDLEDAAQQMGIGFEPFMAILDKLQAKGFTNDFFQTEEDGQQHLTSLYTQLSEAHAELNQLELEGKEGTTVWKAKKDEVDGLEASIQSTIKALEELEKKNDPENPDVQAEMQTYQNQDEVYRQQMVKIANGEGVYKNASELDKMAMLNTLEQDRQANRQKYVQRFGLEMDEDAEAKFVNKINTITDKKQIPFVIKLDETGEKTTEIDLTNYVERLKEKTNIDVVFNTGNIDSVETQIQQVSDWVRENSTEGKLDMSTKGADDAVVVLKQLYKEKAKLETKTNINIDSSQLAQLDEEQEKAYKDLVNLQTAYQDYYALTSMAREHPDLVDEKELETARDNVVNLARTVAENDNQKIGVSVTWNKEDDNSTILSQLNNGFFSPNLTINTNADSVQSQVDELTKDQDKNITFLLPNYQPTEDKIKKLTKEEEKKIKVKVTNESDNNNSDNNNSGNNNSGNKDTGKNNSSGKPPFRVDGTLHAHATGTNVSIPRDEPAVMNELGEEGLIRNGKLIPIRGGMQLKNLKRGDIVVNHKQMKQLKKNGYVTANGGRAKLIGAFAHGSLNGMSAYSGAGSSNGTLLPSTGNSVGTKKSSGSGSDSGSDKTDKALENFNNKLEKLFDWIEVKLTRLKSKTDKWTTAAENAVTNSKKSYYYQKAIKSTKTEMDTNASAAAIYRKQMKDVGKQAVLDGMVSQKWVNEIIGKLDSGRLNIKEYSERKRAVISAMQEWHDKSLECKEAVITLTDSMQDLYTEMLSIPNTKAEESISKINDSLDILQAKNNNLFTAKKKNANIDAQNSKAKSINQKYQDAYATTSKNLKTAKSAINSTKDKALKGLDKKDRNAIKNAVGKNQKIEIKDSWTTKAKNAVAKYNAALDANYTASVNAKKATEEYTTTLRENAKVKFDNIATEYKNKLSLYEQDFQDLDNKIAEVEARGQKANIAYYKSQKTNNGKQLEILNSQKKQLETQLKLIPQYSQEWYDAKSALQDVENEISTCTQKTYELNTAIRQSYFDLFDNIHEEVSRMMNEQEFLRSLYDREKTVDEDTAAFTDAGLANLVSYATQYETAKQQMAKDKAMLQELQDMSAKGVLTNGKYEFDSVDQLNEKIQEMYDTYQSDIKDTYALESSLIDQMKQKYEAQSNLMKELIEDKKDALKAEKDLHSYQRSLAEKTKSVNILQRQINAVRGDTSAEGLANLQNLQKQLADAQDELRETEYEKYISDQEDMMDRMYSDYEELLTKLMDDNAEMLRLAIDAANKSVDKGNDYLKAVAENYGYTSEYSIPNNTSSISKNVGTIINQLTSIETKMSGTGGNGSGSGSGTDGKSENPKPISQNNNGSSGTKPKSSTPSNATRLLQAKAFVKTFASKAGKKKKEYSDVNQKIYDYTNGKVLSTKEMKNLSMILGTKYNNAKSSGNLYKKLKSIKFPGFSKGGKVVAVQSLNDAIRRNNDDGLATLKNGEYVLSRAEAKQFDQLVGSLPELNSIMKTATVWDSLMNDLSNLKSVNPKNVTEIGDVSFQFDLHGVNDPNSLISSIQNSPKVQKAIRSVTIDQIAGNARLSVRNIK